MTSSLEAFVEGLKANQSLQTLDLQVNIMSYCIEAHKLIYTSQGIAFGFNNNDLSLFATILHENHSLTSLNLGVHK